MLVLCYGIPKSESTLAFGLVKGLLKLAQFGRFDRDKAQHGQAQPPSRRDGCGIQCRALRRYGDVIRRVCEQDDQIRFDEGRGTILKYTASEQP
jgi:hypothetical protein